MVSNKLTLTDADQVEAVENAKDAIDHDDEVGFVDADRYERGRLEGEVETAEVVRIACEAYAGALGEVEDAEAS